MKKELTKDDLKKKSHCMLTKLVTWLPSTRRRGKEPTALLFLIEETIYLAKIPKVDSDVPYCTFILETISSNVPLKKRRGQ